MVFLFLLLGLLSPFFTIPQLLGYLFLVGILGIASLIFLTLATFLPVGRRDRPTFTQELLGREKLQYGVYTEGNWMTVLDEKRKEEKQKRR